MVDPTEPGSARTVPDAGARRGATGARYGRFVVDRPLGAGGMGVVLLARDPELDRNVALKLLHPELAAGDGGERLLREAQAMARLSHPNVVTVYEVGRSGDQLFVAMELVEGETLRAWMRGPARSWRDRVAMFVAAGRGLAAAHAAGLVHRDVKPENVLVGADGRARITDFGLVVAGVAPETAAIADDAILHGLTIGGAAVGTPGYMSPEQWTGGAVDARSDQFSFCVALWEALYGGRPFAGSSAAAIRRNVLTGAIREAPAGHGVPARIEPLIRRGLAVDPAARWPSLTALLDALAARAAREGRTIAVGAAAVVVAGSALALGLGMRDASPDPCPAPDDRIARVWSPGRRGAVEKAIVAADPALGAVRFATAAGVVDKGVGEWRTAHVATCRATRVEGRQSDALLDARMRCLDRWLADADRSIGELAAGTARDTVDTAVAGLTRLTRPGACGTAEGFPTPVAPEARAEALAIRAALDQLDAERMAGTLQDAPAKAAALIDRARKLGHPPTLAATLYEAFQFLSRANAPDPALLDELTRVAAIAGNDHVAAYAWVQLVRARGGELDKPEQAEALYATADAALLRAEDPAELRFDLDLARFAGLRDANQLDAAEALLEHAGVAIAAADPARLPSPLLDYQSRLSFARGTLLDARGEKEAAIAMFRRSMAERTELLGPDHPDLARNLINIGEALRQLGKMDEAAEAYAEAARIIESRIGESGMLALVLNRVAATRAARGQRAEALALYRRATALGDTFYPQGHPRRTALHSDLGTALAASGALEDALAEHTVAIDADVAAGRETNNVALALHARGNTLADLGRLADAIADYRRALALIDKLGTGEDYRVQFTFSLADALLDQRKPAEALALLETTAPGEHTEPGLAAWYRYDLGRARVLARRDVKRGLAEARAARDAATAAGLPAEDVAEMDAWLESR
jgi:tetratricopeptide (TPR) repeat protein